MGGPNRTCSTGCRPRLALALLGQPTKTEAFADLAAPSSPIQPPTPPILVQLPVKKREAQVQVLLFCHPFYLMASLIQMVRACPCYLTSVIQEALDFEKGGTKNMSSLLFLRAKFNSIGNLKHNKIIADTVWYSS